MTSTLKKRSKFSHSSETPPKKTEGGKSSKGPKKNRSQQDTSSKEKSTGKWQWSFISFVNIVLGLAAMVAVSYVHSRYMYQIHENTVWFTNIKEVEKEISFRTESGLYYSYYKQVVYAPSFTEGVLELTRDNKTEHPDTINILERMNVYQEVILAFVYRNINTKMTPIFFYINSIFSLHGLLVSGLYLTAWFLSGSWLAGLLTAVFYIFNKPDTTRVQSAIPLRESFSLPFLWMQGAALTVLLKSQVKGILQYLSLITVLACTFFFCLFWQFNQFVMMLQAFSLFGIWILGLVPPQKVKAVMLCQLLSLLAVSWLQFGNKMILASPAVSFMLVSLCLISLLGEKQTPRSVFFHIMRVIGVSLLSLTLMIVLSTAIKHVLAVDSDEHIFKFLLNKFGFGDIKDFDARMYLCLGIFGFITWDTFERLTAGLVLPFYVLAHTIMLIYLASAVIRHWKHQAEGKEPGAKESKTDNKEDTSNSSSTGSLLYRPELAFHVVQSVFFGALASTTMRMKYLWTPYICVLAAVGLADAGQWRKVLSLFRVKNNFSVMVVKSCVLALVLAFVIQRLLPPALKELENETEFWDPDTVELMTWIVKNTPPTASFTGSMQLLAGVKLCTSRPITNHPHYEDKHLRQKTKALYQIYGRRSPKAVHEILKKYKSNYIILEDSICRAPSSGGCRTPDLVDIDNGVMPDEPLDIEGLSYSKAPRFCEEVRYQNPKYSKYFQPVFENKTFRIYLVM